MPNKIDALNKELASLGMAKLQLVDPRSLRSRHVNARYMDQQTMANLVNNVSTDGRLESVPLVWEPEEGVMEIISGHHRVEAAIKAGIEKILVMVSDAQSESEATAKQLSHNAITGKDDEVTLKKLYDSIEDLEARYYSGLQDQLDSVSYQSLNFHAGTFKTFTVAFIDEDIQAYDQAIEQIEKSPISTGDNIRLADAACYDMFVKAIRETKKVEFIKSNASALTRLVELAMEQLQVLKAERKEQEMIDREDS